MAQSTIPVYEIDAFIHASITKGFYCNSLKRHLSEHHFVFVPHKHNFYLSVLFTKGKGKHEIDFKTYDVKPGSLFLLSPGQVHNWILSQDADGYVFFHTREFYELGFSRRKIQDLPFFSSIYTSPLLLPEKNLLQKTIFYFKELLQEYTQGSDVFKEAKLRSLIDLVYIELAKIYQPVKKSRGNNSGYLEKLRKFELLVDRNFRENKSASAYAGLLNITPKHLNRICRSCLNKTSTELITDRIILEAKRILIRKERSVSQVADELGFDDFSYFNRLFRKKTKLTPLQFVSKYKE